MKRWFVFFALLGLALLSGACGQPMNMPDEGTTPGPDAMMMADAGGEPDGMTTPGPDVVQPGPDARMDSGMMGGTCVAYQNPDNPLCRGAATCSCPVMPVSELPRLCEMADLEASCRAAMSCDPVAGTRCSPHLPRGIMAAPCDVEETLIGGRWSYMGRETVALSVGTLSGVLQFGWTVPGGENGCACVGRKVYCNVGLSQQMGNMLRTSVWEVDATGYAVTIRNYSVGTDPMSPGAIPDVMHRMAWLGARR